MVRFPLPFQRVAGYGNIRGHLGGVPSPCGTGREGNTYARCEDGENLGRGEREGLRGPLAAGDGRALREEHREGRQ